MSSIHANGAVRGHSGTTKCLKMNQVNALNVFERNVHTRMFYDHTWVRVIFEFDFSNIVSSATHREKSKCIFTIVIRIVANGSGNNAEMYCLRCSNGLGLYCSSLFL